MVRKTDIKTYNHFSEVTVFIMKVLRNRDFVEPKFTLQYLFHETSLSMIWHVVLTYFDNKKEV